MKRMIMHRIFTGIFVVFLITITIIILFMAQKTTVLGEVVDEITGAPVYGAELYCQGKIIKTFFMQSFVFTNLKPGHDTLRIVAKGYDPYNREIKIKSGSNILKPIFLRAFEIPDINKIYIFARNYGKDSILEIRLVDSAGKGIINPPGMHFRLLVRVYPQLGSNDNAKVIKSKLLYQDILHLNWNTNKLLGHKYYAPIDFTVIDFKKYEYAFLESLLLIPSNENVNSEEMDQFAESIQKLKTENQIGLFLEKNSDKVWALYDTIIDIEGPHNEQTGN